MKIFDITLPLDRSLAMWPGDERYRFSLSAEIGPESVVNIGRVRMSLHAGTHVDAPFHFDVKGATVEAIDLEPFMGPCAVLDAVGYDALDVGLLAQVEGDLPQRVLFKTCAWTDHSTFPTAIPVMTSQLIQQLARRGVALVGIDLPSVDPIDSKDLPNHHALGAASIHILESVDLREVSAGRYELIALPLAIVGGDASPVRALLRRNDP